MAVALHNAVDADLAVDGGRRVFFEHVDGGQEEDVGQDEALNMCHMSHTSVTCHTQVSHVTHLERPVSAWDQTRGGGG